MFEQVMRILHRVADQSRQWLGLTRSAAQRPPQPFTHGEAGVVWSRHCTPALSGASEI